MNDECSKEDSEGSWSSIFEDDEDLRCEGDEVFSLEWLVSSEEESSILMKDVGLEMFFLSLGESYEDDEEMHSSEVEFEVLSLKIIDVE